MSNIDKVLDFGLCNLKPIDQEFINKLVEQWNNSPWGDGKEYVAHTIGGDIVSLNHVNTNDVVPAMCTGEFIINKEYNEYRCICAIDVLMSVGCKCGAMKKERERNATS